MVDEPRRLEGTFNGVPPAGVAQTIGDWCPWRPLLLVSRCGVDCFVSSGDTKWTTGIKAPVGIAAAESSGAPVVLQCSEEAEVEAHLAVEVTEDFAVAALRAVSFST